MRIKWLQKADGRGERDWERLEDRETRRNPEKAETEYEHKVQMWNGKGAV